MGLCQLHCKNEQSIPKQKIRVVQCPSQPVAKRRSLGINIGGCSQRGRICFVLFSKLKNSDYFSI